MLDTPILFLIFNRPESTTKVFERIRDIKPKKLFVAADGPRPFVIGDSENCNLTRSIIGKVDWQCELKTLFRDENLGCGKAVSSAITWFFSYVEEGIILEDDCFPSTSFFKFCSEMLERFRNDSRIMMISGSNFNLKWKDEKQSYHFSYLGGIWGWASWRRAWKYYDFEMKELSNSETRLKIQNNLNKTAFKYRMDIFEKVKNKQIDTWDYQWSYCRLLMSGLSVVPSVNLISNIGFDSAATHTISKNNPFLELKLFDLQFPLKHNNLVKCDFKYDKVFAKMMYTQPFYYRIKCLIKKVFQWM